MTQFVKNKIIVGLTAQFGIVYYQTFTNVFFLTFSHVI